MMTNLSKWMLYISSYCIVYVFLLGVSVFNGWKSVKTIENKSIAEKASLIFSENKFVWCGLVILIAFSLFYVRQFMRQRNNTERVRIEESGTKTDVTRLISARMATEFERGLYYGKNE